MKKKLICVFLKLCSSLYSKDKVIFVSVSIIYAIIEENLNMQTIIAHVCHMAYVSEYLQKYFPQV